MKLNSRRFSAEDFKDAPEWFFTFLSGINQNLQELQSLNTNGVTISDNLKQEILETKFLVDANTFPLKIRTKWNQVPKGVLAVYCVDTEGNSASEYPWSTWSFSNQMITFESITGLTSGKTYKARFLLIYE